MAAAFAGMLADWLHGLIAGTPEEIAGQIWRVLIAIHRALLA